MKSTSNLSINKWNEMSHRERTDWLESNRPLHGKSRNRGTVYGVGINDANYITRPVIDNVMVSCPAYSSWKDMINRSCNNKFKEKNPTYSNVSVCEEWRFFSAFRSWWMANQVDEWQLDKDLVGDGLEYGPDTCVFVPGWLNKFTTNNGASRGSLPVGVSFNNRAKKFQSQCCNPTTGSRGYIGLFSDPDEAYIAWKDMKLKIAEDLRSEMDAIDTRIYDGVIRKINNTKL